MMIDSGTRNILGWRCCFIFVSSSLLTRLYFIDFRKQLFNIDARCNPRQSHGPIGTQENKWCTELEPMEIGYGCSASSTVGTGRFTS
jgi:hypothetical protein